MWRVQCCHYLCTLYGVVLRTHDDDTMLPARVEVDKQKKLSLLFKNLLQHSDVILSVSPVPTFLCVYNHVHVNPKVPTPYLWKVLLPYPPLLPARC